ncbi:MAG: PilZ domain-containing protein [Candidatus Omnitrophota bacterium]
MQDKDLEERLIQDNWLTPQQLVLATHEAKRLNKSIWVSLAKLGILSQDDIAAFFAQESGIPYVRISDYQINSEVICLLEEDFCRQNSVLPLFKIAERLFVACANPWDTTVIDSIVTKGGFDVEPLIASPYSISQAQDYYYGHQEKIFDLRRFILKDKPACSMPFYRSSKRVPFNISVCLLVEAKEVVLNSSSPIEGTTQDISYNGTAIGLHIFLFIPKGTTVILEFRLPAESASPSIIKAKGEIVYCRMEKQLRYFLGVKFLAIEDNARSELLNLAKHNEL